MELVILISQYCEKRNLPLLSLLEFAKHLNSIIDTRAVSSTNGLSTLEKG
jgi:hypothetical protein